MTALQLARKSYNNFQDKMEITQLINKIHRVEEENTKRDDEGYKEDGFQNGTFEKVAKELRSFVSSERKSESIKTLCIDIVSEMKY